MWEVLHRSPAAYQAGYLGQGGHQPKGKSPYATLEGVRSALGWGFVRKNVHFKEVGGVINWQTRAG